MATLDFSSHQVDILFNSDPNPICAGTLISSYLVLTVFSCLKGKIETNLKVRSFQKDAVGNFQIKNVDTIHSFPAFKSEPSESDVAVILLESDFNLDESLSVFGRDSNEPEGFIALSSSALSSFSCGNFTVERTDQADCNSTTDNPNSSCFKPSSKSSCPLPLPVPLIGSGLICEIHGLYFLCGALAGNGTNGIEYTDISKYLNWIRLTFDNHLNGNGDSGHEHELDGVVFGGREVSSSGVSSSIPYQLSLQREKKGKWQHICGAVIIDKRTVLTAAHCFEGNFEPRNFQVVAGVTHLNSTSSLKQILPLQRIIRHHRFNSLNIFKGNDIAIVHVDGSFVYNENVGNIWISPPDGTNPTDFPGRVSGWGQISGIQKVSNSLQEADMKILPDDECSKTWSFLTPSMICSFDNESNTCGGDSGGPLVIQNYQFNQHTKRDLLIGVSSFSHIDCEKRDMPNAFTEVSTFLDWIQENRGLKCGANEFQCFNGQCMDECSLCNGADECGDGSTEKQCEQEKNVTKLKHCARENQQELKNKSQVEEMLLEFVDLLAPSETESRTSEVTSRAARLQVLVGKYGNKTLRAVELVQSMNSTLNRLETTEERLKNETRRAEELTKENQRLKTTTVPKPDKLAGRHGEGLPLEIPFKITSVSCEQVQDFCPNESATFALFCMCSSDDPLSSSNKNGWPVTNRTAQEDQRQCLCFPPAAAQIWECWEYLCEYSVNWEYNVTRHGICRNFNDDVEGVELIGSGSCVMVYREKNCSGTRFRLHTGNKNLGWDLEKQFPNPVLGYDLPKSLGPCW